MMTICWVWRHSNQVITLFGHLLASHLWPANSSGFWIGSHWFSYTLWPKIRLSCRNHLYKSWSLLRVMQLSSAPWLKINKTHTWSKHLSGPARYLPHHITSLSAGLTQHSLECQSSVFLTLCWRKVRQHQRVWQHFFHTAVFPTLIFWHISVAEQL